MSRSTISLFQLRKDYGTERKARAFFEQARWGGKPQCPVCDEKKRIIARPARKGYRCKSCRQDFTVKTGTIFESSNIQLDKWLVAMYQLMTARKGISSMQLAKELGVTQKTAWFILHRLREACGAEMQAMRGEVEIDETYIGGKERNKHASKKLRAGRGTVGKQVIMGMRERGGRTHAKPVPNIEKHTLQGEVVRAVETGATVYTDDLSSCTGLDARYKHQKVNHSAKEFVNGMAHTNGIESVWAVLKRGYNGIYHQWSMKHMSRYVNEFTFRLNDGSVCVHTLDRLSSLALHAVGKRLTYNGLREGQTC